MYGVTRRNIPEDLNLHDHYFLGAFEKLRKSTARRVGKIVKAAISYVMSVRPSARMEQFGFHYMLFDI